MQPGHKLAGAEGNPENTVQQIPQVADIGAQHPADAAQYGHNQQIAGGKVSSLPAFAFRYSCFHSEITSNLTTVFTHRPPADS